MAQPVKTKGLIIKQINYSDYDKMLTIISEDFGRISVSAKGVRSMKSKSRAACELLCFDEFVLSPGKNDVYTIISCELIESFYSLRSDCIRLAVGVYMADIAGQLSPEDIKGLLRLLLNTLFMLQDESKEPMLLKCIYDLKLLSEAGFTPETDGCINCGAETGPFYFNALSGGVICKKCGENTGLHLISEKTRKFISYIISAPLSKGLFEVSVDKNTLDETLEIVDNFINIHVSDNIKTLEYLKKIVNL
ncbi:MAG: DNA repair protein RecO [Bacillota bacterium]|nr:DNA repair protein RecO [Bacillota bacterium]